MKIRIAFSKEERRAAERIIQLIKTVFPLLKCKEDKKNGVYKHFYIEIKKSD